ncbi:MAG: amino acid permease C-terminal domain-containing protein [Longimicrobiales bacterium]
MVSLPWDTWLRLILWMAVGLVIYFAYSRHRNVLQRTGETVDVEVPTAPTYTEPLSEED